MEPSTSLQRKIAMRECYADHDACVTIVDDERINIEVVKAYLTEAGFSNFRSTTDSRTALNLMEEHAPDILLLDINMPHISGLEILESLRKEERFHHLPVLILTAADDPEVKLQALGLGATDFLAKPVDPSELALRMENVLAAKAYQDQLAKHSEMLEEMVRERTRELEESRQEAIHCLAKAGEYRDDDTGQHVTRVGHYTRILATELGFPSKEIELIEQAAKLHDLGKIGIPDAILHKAGKLEPEEYQIIQQHCGIGCEIMNPSNEDDASTMRQHATIGPKILSSTRSPLLKLAAKIAGSHHEKWDGSGYPLGLRGEDIPIEGRIVAVADVFDALSSSRPYKDAFNWDQCIEILENGRNSHFDPKILDAFLRSQDEIAKVQQEYNDPEAIKH